MPTCSALWPYRDRINLLARWRRYYLTAQAVAMTPALIPVHVVESQPAPFPSRARPGGDGGSGEIEIRQAGTVLFIRGTPESAVLNLVLRELLQHGSALPK